MLRSCKIFISYSLIDDYPSGKNQEGWVTCFVRFLKEMLLQVDKECQFDFFLEHQNNVNTDYLNERRENLKQSDFFITIVSPDFISAEPSLILLNEFKNHLENSRIESKQRILKVVKLPIQSYENPDEIRDFIGFSFFNINKETGTASVVEEFFAPEAKSSFWLPLTDLCFEIKKHLDTIAEATPKTLFKAEKKYVYLAQTSIDLEFERLTIKRELERRNYKVLPEQNFPDNPILVENFIKDNLKQSLLSIHLIGNQSGEKPLGREETYVEIQNGLAAEYASDIVNQHGEFPRLIWIASEEKHIEEKQKFYIEKLKRDKQLQFGAEILQTQIEDFKTAILNYLASHLDKSFNPNNNSQEFNKSIYLITDKRDITYAHILSHKIAEMGFEVMISAFDRKKANSRRTHQECLNKCDMVFVLYFDAKKEWLVSKLQDIIKTAGMGRVVPFEKQVIITNQEYLNIFLDQLNFIKDFSFAYNLIETSNDDNYQEVSDFLKELIAQTIIR
ncbi:MAG: hypothetical protein CMO01_21875 [Thalassobius sp.]|nr:hypothetical protein [Thalassovita sp.]